MVANKGVLEAVGQSGAGQDDGLLSAALPHALWQLFWLLRLL
jgi:hypothetical protein